GLSQIIFRIPALLFIVGLMCFRHMDKLSGKIVFFIGSSVQCNPVHIMKNLHMVTAVDNLDIKAYKSVGDTVIMPVLPQKDMVVFLDFCFGIVPELIRTVRQGKKTVFFLIEKNLLPAE